MYIPSRGPEIILRGIMPAFAVPAEEEELVADVLGGVGVQVFQLAVEAFPLGYISGSRA